MNILCGRKRSHTLYTTHNNDWNDATTYQFIPKFKTDILPFNESIFKALSELKEHQSVQTWAELGFDWLILDILKSSWPDRWNIVPSIDFGFLFIESTIALAADLLLILSSLLKNVRFQNPVFVDRMTIWEIRAASEMVHIEMSICLFKDSRFGRTQIHRRIHLFAAFEWISLKTMLDHFNLHIHIVAFRNL